MSDKVKIEVGQVWANNYCEFVITKVDKGACYYIDADGSEKVFGHLEPDGSGTWIHGLNGWFLKEATVQTTNGSSTAINDHVCPTCKNTRCSKTEKSCWRCGNPLH